MIHLKAEFIAHLLQQYPGLQAQPLDKLVSENLVSPFNVELPTNILTQAQEIVAAAFALREQTAYQNFFAHEIQKNGLIDPGNKSILMSYDFHLNEQGELKLIEINTNAAFLLLGLELYRMKTLPLPIADFSHEEIRKMILQELTLFGNSIKSPSVVIIDEEPEKQKLYVEFLTYNELFKSFGWQSKITDYRKISDHPLPDFIYNRFTDFMLTGPNSSNLRKNFLSKEVCLSPHPLEYFLLADKQRMIDWCAPGFLEKMELTDSQIATLRCMLPAAYELNKNNKEALWSQRKKLFFKPKRAFGSKLSYRGSSISRKHFEDLDATNEEMIAQEFIPPAEKTFETPTGPQSFKYDLRFYAYQGRLQTVVARLYQGQVTNLRTPLGGFACVVFS